MEAALCLQPLILLHAQMFSDCPLTHARHSRSSCSAVTRLDDGNHAWRPGWPSLARGREAQADMPLPPEHMVHTLCCCCESQWRPSRNHDPREWKGTNVPAQAACLSMRRSSLRRPQWRRRRQQGSAASGRRASAWSGDAARRPGSVARM